VSGENDSEISSIIFVAQMSCVYSRFAIFRFVSKVGSMSSSLGV